MADDYTALLTGSTWGGIEATNRPVIVTYSFGQTGSPPAYISTATDPNLSAQAIASYAGFSLAEQVQARDALAEWGDVSGLIFLEVGAGQGDIQFQKMDLQTTGYAGAGGVAFYPFGDWQFASYPDFTSDLDYAGDVIMNSAIAIDYGTLVHEIGHALGLKHPTEAWTDFAAEPDVVHAVWVEDDGTRSIMSDADHASGLIDQPTALDIEAIQAIYGTQAQDGSQVASWSWNAGTATLTQTGYATADSIRGSSVRDVIDGANGDDRLFGLNGDDDLAGGVGDDLLDGGPGIDAMAGGDGDDDYFVSASGDSITELADEGFDEVFAVASYVLSDNVENLILWTNLALAGTGNALDNAIFGNTAANALNGLGGGDYLVGGSGADAISGGAGLDSLYGEDDADTLRGGNDGDYVNGGGGADRLYGDGGDDTLEGGAGDDWYFRYAGDGADVMIEALDGGSDRVTSYLDITLGDNIERADLLGAARRATGNALANTLVGASGSDLLEGLGAADLLYGRNANDTLKGGAGADRLYGEDGIDTLLGEGENDRLEGGAGRDVLDGGAGADIMIGGAARDVLTGGAGADRFYFYDGDFEGPSIALADQILDFSHAEADKIDLHFVDANSAATGNQAFAFIGTAGFSDTAGQLRHQAVGGFTYLYADTNGDKAADFTIRLGGGVIPVAGDFVL